MKENNKFVSDSDTKTEWEEWQQSQNRCIDEEKLMQQCKNRQSNASGQRFEKEILAGCKLYRERGIAQIDKTPEPFRVSKKGKNGIFTGRFHAPASRTFKAPFTAAGPWCLKRNGRRKTGL